ncbi:hypothetical protein APY03_1235 [Variovorax sp. WDL1]|nr:hypothetical protein APY03_1235 [Variovorax sp. WDL1]
MHSLHGVLCSSIVLVANDHTYTAAAEVMGDGLSDAASATGY